MSRRLGSCRWGVLVASLVVLLSLCVEAAAHVDTGPRRRHFEDTPPPPASLEDRLRAAGPGRFTGPESKSGAERASSDTQGARGTFGQVAASPTVQLTVNGRSFDAGQQLTLGLTVQNPVGNPPADLYVGAMLPDREFVVFFSAPGVLGGTTTLRALSALRPVQPAPPGASLSFPTFFQFTLPASGIPSGTYQVFAGLLPQGASFDGTQGSSPILALDMKAVILLPPPPLAPSVGGQWSTAQLLPLIPIHLHMLPTGKVLMWPGEDVSGDNAMLWDPATGGVTPALALSGFDIFCSGHSFLADGRLLVAGGRLGLLVTEGPAELEVGAPDAAIYDPFGDAWSPLPRMNAGRWYPTNTTLANGDVLVSSGTIDLMTGENLLPQVFEVARGTWRDLITAELELPSYPQMFLAPNGTVVSAGPDPVTRSLDTRSTGSWSVVATRTSGHLDLGSAVMYDGGRVLVAGGGLPPTRTAEVIDLTTPFPSWRSVAPMAYARQLLNATLLPDGTVLVTGGSSGPAFNDPTAPVFTSELWDPKTESWAMMADAQVPRLYHSAALLLPDGRVIATGGNRFGGQRELEIFEPPYLFKGPRPTLTAPTSVTYGATFFVPTPDAASIAQVTWLRLGSVTHGFDQNQRFNRLSFSSAPAGLEVQAPSDPNLSPPGHYLLFILNGAGVPSVGQIIRIQ